MSSMEILERFNEASRNSIDISPKVRIKAIKDFLTLLYDAPELKISIISKLEQLIGDNNEEVAAYAKRIFDRIQAGGQYYPYRGASYEMPRRSQASSRESTTTRSAESGQVKSVVANLICCVIMLIIYFVITGMI
ncbi:MAG: hypothetical protein ACTSRS_19990 [Candidatus Helarchaeota archaeon]